MDLLGFGFILFTDLLCSLTLEIQGLEIGADYALKMSALGISIHVIKD